MVNHSYWHLLTIEYLLSTVVMKSKKRSSNKEIWRNLLGCLGSTGSTVFGLEMDVRSARAESCWGKIQQPNLPKSDLSAATNWARECRPNPTALASAKFRASNTLKRGCSPAHCFSGCQFTVHDLTLEASVRGWLFLFSKNYEPISVIKVEHIKIT